MSTGTSTNINWFERIEEERLLDPDHAPTASEVHRQRFEAKFAELVNDDDYLTEAFSIESVPDWHRGGEVEHFNRLRYCLLQYRRGQTERAAEVGQYLLDNALTYLEDAAADKVS